MDYQKQNSCGILQYNQGTIAIINLVGGGKQMTAWLVWRMLKYTYDESVKIAINNYQKLGNHNGYKAILRKAFTSLRCEIMEKENC